MVCYFKLFIYVPYHALGHILFANIALGIPW